MDHLSLSDAISSRTCGSDSSGSASRWQGRTDRPTCPQPCGRNLRLTALASRTFSLHPPHTLRARNVNRDPACPAVGVMTIGPIIRRNFSTVSVLFFAGTDDPVAKRGAGDASAATQPIMVVPRWRRPCAPSVASVASAGSSGHRFARRSVPPPFPGRATP